MSAIGYNNLLFKTIKRLNESNAGEQLRFMCRDMVAQRDEQSIKELFQELERNGFLSIDKLEVLKDLLKGLEEWSLFRNVISFERKRKEYISLLERIIHVLDELDCLEQLVAICSDRIPEEEHGSIQDVRSLLKELEDKDSLRIDRLELLKKILTQKQQTDLHWEVEEFEQRINREDEFEWRKGIFLLPNVFPVRYFSCVLGLGLTTDLVVFDFKYITISFIVAKLGKQFLFTLAYLINFFFDGLRQAYQSHSTCNGQNVSPKQGTDLFKLPSPNFTV